MNVSDALWIVNRKSCLWYYYSLLSLAREIRGLVDRMNQSITLRITFSSCRQSIDGRPISQSAALKNGRRSSKVIRMP